VSKSPPSPSIALSLTWPSVSAGPVYLFLISSRQFEFSAHTKNAIGGLTMWTTSIARGPNSMHIMQRVMTVFLSCARKGGDLKVCLAGERELKRCCMCMRWLAKSQKLKRRGRAELRKSVPGKLRCRWLTTAADDCFLASQ
jgi:hypothetical protein